MGRRSIPFLTTVNFLLAHKEEDLRGRWGVYDEDGKLLGLAVKIGDGRFVIPIVEAPEGATSPAWPDDGDGFGE